MIKKLINYFKNIKYSIQISYYDSLVTDIEYLYITGEINIRCKNSHFELYRRKLKRLTKKKEALS